MWRNEKGQKRQNSVNGDRKCFWFFLMLEKHRNTSLLCFNNHGVKDVGRGNEKNNHLNLKKWNTGKINNAWCLEHKFCFPTISHAMHCNTANTLKVSKCIYCFFTMTQIWKKVEYQIKHPLYSVFYCFKTLVCTVVRS